MDVGIGTVWRIAQNFEAIVMEKMAHEAISNASGGRPQSWIGRSWLYQVYLSNRDSLNFVGTLSVRLQSY
jgi:hypothetical protein